MANLALVFDVLAKDNASSTFRNVGDAADRAGKQTSGFGAQMAGAMKVAGAALLGAGLIEGFKNLYQAADESRKIAALTTQVIKSTGGAANVSAKQVSDLAGAIAKKTGVDDEAIQSGQNLLLTFTNVRNEVGKGNNIFDQATQTITDMSVALGQDTSSSAIQLGKALNDPIKGVTALQRVGVSFTASQKEQIATLVESGRTLDAQKLILAELGKEFGGAAEAASTPLGKLQQRAGDLAEQIGGYLVPIVDKAATFFSEKLLPALSDAGSIIGGTVVPAFKAITTVVGAVADVFNALPGPLQAAVLAIGAFTLLKGPVSGALETIGLKALYAKDAITSGGGLKGAFSSLAGALTPVTIGIGAAIALLPALIQSFKALTGNSDSAAAGQRSLAEALRDTNGVMDENARKAAQQQLVTEGLIDVLDKAGVSGRDAIDGLLGNADAQGRVNKALQDYITETMRAQGPVNTNTAAVSDAQLKYQQLAESLGMSKQESEFFADAAVSAGSASGVAADGASDFASATEDARDALSDAKQAIDDYKLSLDILTGNTVSMLQVEASLNDAISAGKDAMDKLGGAVLDASGSLNLQTENGRKAADVLLDVRNRGNDLIATLIQQGATTDVVAAKDAALRASFIKTANEMGITGENAERLADQILGIPGQRNTTITADTGQATGAVQALQKQIDGLHGRTVAILARGSLADVPGVQRFGLADGGPVPGWSPHSRADNIPLMGTAGEFMQPVPAVRKYGKGFMESVRSGRFPAALAKGYADGGLIEVIADVSDFAANLKGALTPTGVAGGGALGGAWGSIWQYVKARVPQARMNSTFRAGDPGYHGKGKAIDFGFGSGPGGSGSAGLALINRILHDGVGRNLAELIYDGLGDDRPDLKNGAPHTYNAGTRADHRNHVHAAVYDQGGILPPGLTFAYNGTGRNETIRTAGQEAALSGPTYITHVTVDRDADKIARAIQESQRIREFLHG